MEQLSTLKEKIQRIVSFNTSLKEQLVSMQVENERLRIQVSQLESALERESSTAASFSSQAEELNDVISELLTSLDETDARI